VLDGAGLGRFVRIDELDVSQVLSGEAALSCPLFAFEQPYWVDGPEGLLLVSPWKIFSSKVTWVSFVVPETLTHVPDVRGELASMSEAPLSEIALDQAAKFFEINLPETAESDSPSQVMLWTTTGVSTVAVQDWADLAETVAEIVRHPPVPHLISGWTNDRGHMLWGPWSIGSVGANGKGSGVAPTLSHEEAVLLYLRPVAATFDLDRFEDTLSFKVVDAGVGEFDGHDIEYDQIILYLYGRDATALWATIADTVRAVSLGERSCAVVRRGPPGSAETTIALAPTR
jgi:hypothetical protein